MFLIRNLLKTGPKHLQSERSHCQQCHNTSKHCQQDTAPAVVGKKPLPLQPRQEWKWSKHFTVLINQKQKQGTRSSDINVITHYSDLPWEDITPSTAGLIKQKWDQCRMSPITSLHNQCQIFASRWYQPQFNCILRRKLRTAPMMTHKFVLTFTKVRITWQKSNADKSVLEVKRILKHRLD